MVKIIFIVFLSVYFVLVLENALNNFSLLPLADCMVKVIPVLILSILALVGALCSSGDAWMGRTASFLLIANAVVLFVPSSYQRPASLILCSMAVVLFYAIYIISGLLMTLPCIVEEIIPVVVSLLLLFQIHAVKKHDSGEYFSDLSLILDSMAILVMLVYAEEMENELWGLPLLSVLMLVMLFYVSALRYPGSIFRKVFDRFKKAGDAEAFEESKDSTSMSRQDELYERLERYMMEEEPYLDEDLTISSLAREMFTNKTSLSKAINLKSGKHFCAYVNEYRIRYSLKIMKRDCRVKVVELAVMSGFHSVASFNMAFRLYTGETPSEYMRTLKAMELHHSSTPAHDSGTGAVT